MAVEMTQLEVEQFLDSQPGWMTLSTVGVDGFPHSVPLGYFRDGASVYLGCRDKTQKVVNIERNSKVSLCLESGSSMTDIKGVLLQGRAFIVRDDDERLALHQRAAELRGEQQQDLPSTVSAGSVYIKVAEYSVISWRYGA